MTTTKNKTHTLLRDHDSFRETLIRKIH